MSTVKIQGNVSGTGSITIAAPNTNSDLTMSLPAAGGTIASFASLTNNGVAYVNGSGQPTSGSALTFDGTNGGTTGNWTAGNLASVSGGYVRVNRSDNATYNEIKYATGDLFYFNQANGGAYQFNISGSEQMRLTSTGLGIGTSSPSRQLDVKKTAIFDSNGDGTTTNPSIAIGSTSVGLSYIGGSQLAFITNSAEKMRLDTSGNLGLGVTPSAWATYTGTQALQIGSGGVSIYGTGSGWSAAAFMYLSNNAYYSSSAWRYLRSVPAAQYVQASGEHQWFSAGSGTAGNAISFTQAMTLSQSSGSTTLEITSNNAINQFATLRINSPYYNTWDLINDGTLRFVRGGSEFMRIDSSGNLLVGTTSNPYTGRIVGYGAPFVSHSTGTTATDKFYFVNGNGIVGYIQTNGSSTSYNTSSDYRLKENIQPMTGALAKVAALKPCTYNWKVDGSDGEGFIAHELAEVVPQCVTGEKDAVDADGNPVYQGIDTSFLVATLTAAIQELKAQVDAQAAEIAALKGTV